MNGEVWSFGCYFK